MGKVKKPRLPVKMKSKTRRRGDEMVTVIVEKRPAVVDYAAIRKAACMEHDDRACTPWEDDQCYEHELVKNVDQRAGYADAWPEINKARGFVGGHRTWFSGNNLVTLSDKHVDGLLDPYNPASGEHRQVYAERRALLVRRLVAAIVKFYEAGWIALVATCEFDDYFDCLSGFVLPGGDWDDSDPALQEALDEVAGMVADQMAKDGYEVVNRPKPWNSAERESKQTCLRARTAYRLGFNDTEAYRKWLTNGKRVP